jgi:hypothetical protein
METDVKTCSPAVERHPRDGLDVLDAFHREVLVQMHKLAALLEGSEGCSPTGGHRACATELMAFFSGPARQHNIDEERHVFAGLLESEDPGLRKLTERLHEEHAWVELYWLDVERQLKSLAAAAPDFDVDALRVATGSFLALYREHIALEESLLYPQAREHMDAGDRQTLARVLARSARRVKSATVADPGKAGADRRDDLRP